jgi:hypothetical protein
MLLGNEAEASSVEIEAALVDALPDWPSSHLFTAMQRACLAFTDQFVTDVALLTDEQAQAVADELGGDGLSSFVDALLVIEQRQRLRLVWTRILPGVAT